MWREKKKRRKTKKKSKYVIPKLNRVAIRHDVVLDLFITYSKKVISLEEI